MFGLSKDPVALARSTAALEIFTRELGWNGGDEWVIEQMTKGDGQVVRHGVSYKLQVAEDLGIVTLGAMPAER